MTPQSIQMLLTLALGFAVAGSCASGYRLVTSRLPSFSLLSTDPRAAALAAVPLLILAAPFLIIRNTLFGVQRQGRRFEFVVLTTLIAGFWSLMSGLALITVLRACGIFLT